MAITTAIIIMDSSLVRATAVIIESKDYITSINMIWEMIFKNFVSLDSAVLSTT